MGPTGNSLEFLLATSLKDFLGNVAGSGCGFSNGALLGYEPMRSKYLRAVTALLTMISVLAAAGAGAPAERPGVSDEHQRIVEFWTNERVAQAIPRDFVLAESGAFQPRAKPDKPDKPGGGEDDGGDTTGTTAIPGASWEGGGLVADTTGKVLFVMGGSYYVCSASVVTDGAAGRSIVLTAAHCVYDETADMDEGFASNWMFIPNYDASPASLNESGSFCGDTEYGCWTAD